MMMKYNRFNLPRLMLAICPILSLNAGLPPQQKRVEVKPDPMSLIAPFMTTEVKDNRVQKMILSNPEDRSQKMEFVIDDEPEMEFLTGIRSCVEVMLQMDQTITYDFLTNLMHAVIGDKKEGLI